MDDKPTRDSVYLSSKCEALLTALEFFFGKSGNSNTPGKMRRAIFMAQLPFWDWEMDELIFSFDTYKERSQQWNANIVNIMQTQKYFIRQDVLNDLRHADTMKKWNEMWYSTSKQVVAPYDKLNEVIDKWNTLLKFCEDTMMVENGNKMALEYGINNVITDLQQYRKKPVMTESS